jgi:hypothetical protein
MFPVWLHTLSIIALLLGAACSMFILIDVFRQPRSMAVMNVVWPVSALFGTVVVLWAYFRHGQPTGGPMHRAGDQEVHGEPDAAFPVAVGKSTLHCGAGCTLGDIAAEWLAFGAPAIAVWFGWHSIFTDKMYAVWGLDFVFAFALGIVFQYFAIVPMRHLSPGEGILAALKADTLSLTAWQIGMYGAMAFIQLHWFAHVLGQRAEVNTPEFWFAMQLAMIAGFVTSYPVNWWLVRSGIKEKM